MFLFYVWITFFSEVETKYIFSKFTCHSMSIKMYNSQVSFIWAAKKNTQKKRSVYTLDFTDDTSYKVATFRIMGRSSTNRILLYLKHLLFFVVLVSTTPRCTKEPSNWWPSRKWPWIVWATMHRLLSTIRKS